MDSLSKISKTEDEEFAEEMEKMMAECGPEYHAAWNADQAEFDQAINKLFDHAFAKVEAREMPIDKLRQFFPQTR